MGEGTAGKPLTLNALAQADAACGVSPGAMGCASNGDMEDATKIYGATSLETLRDAIDAAMLLGDAKRKSQRRT